MEFKHCTVLADKSVDFLNIKGDGIYVDGTLGGGGHAELICQKLATGRLIGIDRDESALAAARVRLEKYNKVTFINGNYSDINGILDNLGIEKTDGVILDLGVSSAQLDTPERGFSYRYDSKLDMRMNPRDSLTAYDIVNSYPEDRLADIIFKYGEERFARRIAKFIVNRRGNCSIETTFELVDIIKSAMGARAYNEDKHPAKRTFQALRIEVNGELEALKQGIREIMARLAPEGRLAVITFHSLEDRIVKQEFAALSLKCKCPPSFPVCVCGGAAEGKLITKRPVLPGENEMNNNPRSKSAKLRVIEKI